MIPKSENDEDLDGVGQTILVDKRLGSSNQDSNLNQVVTV